MFDDQRNPVVLRHILPSLLLVLLAMGIVMACAQSTTSNSSSSTGQRTIPTITIKAMDYSYDQPRSIPAGLIDLTFVNNGGEPHQANIFHLNTGVTFAQFQSALRQYGPAGALRLGAPVGGPNTILPGKSQEVILNFPPGQYASICFATGKDNIPHYMKGMVQSFIATGQDSESQVQPKANGEVVLEDLKYILPTTLSSGPITLHVSNQGIEPHEMTLYQLAPGKSIKDAIAFLQQPAGAPPMTEAGGMAALEPGSSAWVKLNLQAGNYLALCFVPDPTGKPYVMLGMITQFAVR